MACKRCSERGANLIEAALILPLLLLLIGGIVDFGGAFNRYIAITNAAREGARYGSKFPHYYAGIVDATTQEASNLGVTLTSSDISIAPMPTPAVRGTTITVTVTYSYTTLIGGVIGAPVIPLRTSTSMIVFGKDNGPKTPTPGAP